MKHLQRRIIAGFGAVAIGGALLAAAGAAGAAGTTPGFEPDANAFGTITFYNAGGHVITGGALDAKPFAAYAVASHVGRPASAGHGADDKAALYMATPTMGANPLLWSNDQLGASAFKPVPAGVPASVTATGKPFVVGSDLTMDDYIGEYPNNSAVAGYQNIYEARIFTNGPSNSADTTRYDRVDIQVDTTANTWTVVYPTPLAPPTVKTAPSVTGSVKLGGTATCTVVFNGATTTSYTWLVNNAAVKGATAKTFKIPDADFNKKLSCKVTASNSGGALVKTSPQKVIAKGAALKKSAAPKLSSKNKKSAAIAGTFEYASHGTWSPSATKYAYAWLINGKAVAHATASKFKIPTSAAGKKISCKVTAMRKNYANGVATTTAVKVAKKK